jgi:hypothetical protein
MEAAAHTPGGYDGVPQSVGKEFVAHDSEMDSPKTELDTARLIQSGELPSPQKVGNMWLFNMRITGTGTAYRSKIDQYVYREPENYLNDEFLARCNGLTVIWEHPEGNKLTSYEFAARTVGSIFLPYIKEDEVWGIAKIYDDEAAEEMIKGRMSTSPTVIFSNILENNNIIIEKDYNILIEGIPSIIDHLAICENGVWDKGEQSSGIIVNNEEAKKMLEDENKPDGIAAADGDEPAEAITEEKKDVSLDERILSLIEKFMAGREPTEKIKADDLDANDPMKMPDAPLAAAADSEEKKEESYADSVSVDLLKKQVAALERKIPRQRTASEFDQLAIAQSQAEQHYMAFGDSVSVCRPMDGETVTGYRKRMIKGLQKHSPKFGKIDISAISDDSMLSIVEDGIYADSMTAARMPSENSAHGLPRAIKSQDEVGRNQIHYVGGRPLSVFDSFRQKPRHVVDLRPLQTQH